MQEEILKGFSFYFIYIYFAFFFLSGYIYFAKKMFLTFGPIRGEELLHGNVVNDGPTGGVILHTKIRERQRHLLFLCTEGPRVWVPPLHIIQCLQVYGLRCRWHRDVQRLQLSARASRTKRDGVNGALLHR